MTNEKTVAMVCQSKIYYPSLRQWNMENHLKHDLDASHHSRCDYNIFPETAFKIPMRNIIKMEVEIQKGSLGAKIKV